MKSVIRHISPPYPAALFMARRDHAIVTSQDMVERPFWFEDTTTGFMFHDLYACVGWPSEVADKDIGMPGYAAIVGVIRPPDLKKDAHYDPTHAKFLLLREAEDSDVPGLIEKCLELREKYGFGCQPDLLTIFLGDPERFTTTLALRNEMLIRDGGDRNALLIAPPDDFYVPKIFDIYIRSLRSCLVEGRQRFFFGKNDILKNRIREFRRDDPSVLAAGGLVHSLLNRCMWMSQANQSTIFNVEDAA